MNLQQLRYVVATADVGTMTAAAATLHVAQPALSRAVRALEQELGITIFARDGRGLRLTEQGRDVVAIACRVVAEVERLALLGHSTVLRVSATPGQARELGSPAVSRQVKERGDRMLLAVVDSRDEVFDAVRNGEAHLGIAELPAPGDLGVLSLGWQEIVLVHPPSWDLPEPLPLHMLRDLPLLVAPPDDWRRGAVESGLRAHGIEPKIAAETTDRDLLLRLVNEGVGAAFSYGSQATRACAAGAKRARFDPPAVREVGVLYAVEPTGDAARFVEQLKAEAANLLLRHDDPQVARAGRVAGTMLLCRGGRGRELTHLPRAMNR